MSAALVPVKRLRSGKSRLVADLDRGAVEKLTLAMLEDVVDTLERVPEVSSVSVVTPDEAVARAAQSFGARPLLLRDPGLNASLDAAARRLAAEGARELLVMLGDVAGALLRAPHDVIPSRFGPESAEAHRELALRAGVPHREVPLPSLAVDLDCREDLDAFLARPEGGPRTRALLASLGVAER